MTIDTEHKRESLDELKRRLQERDREQVRSGQRTQRDLFFFSPETIRRATVHHRSIEF